MSKSLKSGEARCPAPTVQEILAADASRMSSGIAAESYTYLGDSDIPYDRYYADAFYQQEMEDMWTRVWQWACRIEDIPEPGDCYVYEIGTYSILIMRVSDTEIKAYHNVCLHRGTKLRDPGSGHAKDLRCPYHGWTWNTDGSLKEIPCRWDFPHVTDENFSLREVLVDTWAGFVFVNMDRNAPPLLDYLEVIPEHFRRAGLENRYISVHVEKELPCNWKLATEAFLEAYHTMETHPQILTATGDANAQYDIFGDHVTRFYAAIGVRSPHITETVTEQQLLDSMILGDSSAVNENKVLVPEGETARSVMARHLRSIFSQQYKADLSNFPDSEIIDTIHYHIFPNLILHLGFSLPMVYRFRPLDNDPNRTLFDLIFIKPLAEGEENPGSAEPVRLKVEEPIASLASVDPIMAAVYDQDTRNLRLQYEGIKASPKWGSTLGNYQEVRIRRLHQTLDKYIKRKGV